MADLEFHNGELKRCHELIDSIAADEIRDRPVSVSRPNASDAGRRGLGVGIARTRLSPTERDRPLTHASFRLAEQAGI